MKCPVDGEVLAMSERRGIEVDYCPSCRGIWLDRGELDKLIEAEERDRDDRPVARDSQPRERHRDEDSRGSGREKPKKKKSSFLSEIFEMGG